MSSGLNWVVGRSDGVVMSLVTSTTAFAGAARDFVDEMAALGIDVRDDAVELARGAIDVDGFLTNEELAAFIVTFESMRSDLVGARPEDLRREGVFQGGRRSLTHPSSAFIAARVSSPTGPAGLRSNTASSAASRSSRGTPA